MPTDSEKTAEKQQREADLEFLRESLLDLFGEKCAESDGTCCTCRVWKAFDALVTDKALLDSGCIHTGPKEAGVIHSSLNLRERINLALSGCMDM